MKIYQALAFENLEKFVQQLKDDKVESISIQELENVMRRCSSDAFVKASNEVISKIVW